MARVKSTLISAAIASGSVLLAFLITRWLHSIFPTPLFFGAIIVSTWYGGTGSGLLAILLASGVLDYYFVPPGQRFTARTLEFAYLIQFLAPALITCWRVKKRKDVEVSLKQSRAELETRVRERTSELREANERLTQQIAERIRAEETAQKTQAALAHVTRVTTLGELAASIAHEVNQPLMAVVLNGDACLGWLDRPEPNLAEAREAVGRIIGEGNRAGEIIRRIRALFQKSPMQKEPVNVNETVGDIVALTQREMARHGVECATKMGQGLPPVLGDAVQLQQVVLNLAMNAIEAMSGAGEEARELRIETQVRGAGGDEILVTVRDSGRGLPAEEPERIFGAFFTTKPDGLGMGLSISRTIVEAHGGKLWAESSSAGAVFRFTLPAWKGAA